MALGPRVVAWGGLTARVSADAGATWAECLGGVTPAAAYPDVWAGGNGAFYACHDGNSRVLKSTDNGVTFAVLGNPVHAVRFPRSVCRLPSGRLIVGLSAAGAPDNTGPAIAHSDDEGLTWTFVAVDVLVNRSTRKRTLWSVGAKGGAGSAAAVVLFCDVQIWRSPDSGATWAIAFTPFGGRSIDHLWVDPGQVNVVLAAQHDPGGMTNILRSADAGATWGGVVGGDLPLSTDPNDPPRSAFARRAVPNEILFSGPTGSGVKSADGGLNWSALGTDPGGKGTIGLYRTDGALLSPKTAVAVGDRSTDNAATWAAMGALAPNGNFAADALEAAAAGGEDPAPTLRSSVSMMGLLLNARIRRRRRVPGELPS